MNHEKPAFFSKPIFDLCFGSPSLMKIAMYLLLLLLSSTAAFAQNEEWVWAISTGGIFNEARGERVVTDNDGHVVVAGTFSCPQITFGSITLINEGGDDLFVVKLDTSGIVLWAKSAGGDYAEEGYAVATDEAGNVYVSGEFWSPSVLFGSYTLTNSGSADLFLVKYDASGNVAWAKSAAGTGEDISQAVTVDGSGNVYIAGSYTSDNIDFGGITLSNSQSNIEDFFLAKYDSNGNPIWARHATGFGIDKAFGVGTDASGNVLVSGHFSSGTLNFGSQTLSNSGAYDIFLAKYDEDGNLLWAKNPSGSGYDFNFSMETDATGNAYLTGHFSSFQLNFGGVTVSNGGGDDIYVVKYDAMGTAVWAQKAGGPGYDYGYDVTVDGSGNVYLTGNFQSTVISFGVVTLTNSSGFADYYIAKYNDAGELVWAENGDASDYAFGRGCGADASGVLYVTGLFGNSTLQLGNLTLTTASGATDMFLARYGNSNCNTVFYQDADNDSYGNASVTATGCTAPSGYVSDSTDCNDNDPSITGPTTWFLDADNDGYGQPEINLLTACLQPPGYVDNNTDCNDSLASVNPGALEIPNNGIDDDCDGLVDEVATATEALFVNSAILQIFPNPTRGNLYLLFFAENGFSGKATIGLMDLLGRQLQTQCMVMKNGIAETEIHFSPSISEGIYWIVVTIADQKFGGEEGWIKKMVYQK